MHATGGHFLVPLNWQNIPLRDSAGAPFDILAALRSLPEAEPRSFSAQTAPDRHRQIPAVAARLAAIRKSEAAAEAGRQRVLQERSRKSRAVDPRTLEAAGYIFVLTSLRASVEAAQVLELYRFRRQIELAFKRLKRILHLDQLHAKDPALARTILYSKLLAALLVEDFTDRLLAISPGATLSVQRDSVSLWRVQRVPSDTLRHVILGHVPLQRLLQAQQRLRRHFCDTPRRRTRQTMQTLVWTARLS